MLLYRKLISKSERVQYMNIFENWYVIEPMCYRAPWRLLCQCILWIFKKVEILLDCIGPGLAWSWSTLALAPMTSVPIPTRDIKTERILPALQWIICICPHHLEECNTIVTEALALQIPRLVLHIIIFLLLSWIRLWHPTHNIPFSCYDVFGRHQQETVMVSMCICVHVCVYILFSEDRSPAEPPAIVWVVNATVNSHLLYPKLLLTLITLELWLYLLCQPDIFPLLTFG